MERRTCKLCFKSFSNGRALGGHMRSHMAALQPPPPPEQPPPPPPPRYTIESASSSSTSSSSEEEEIKAAMLSYGLRENPKKSFRLVDPEFSFVDAGSVVVQDRESETESSKNPSRRRSKRTRKSGAVAPLFLLRHQHHQYRHQQQQQQQQQQQYKKPKLVSIPKRDLIVEPEPMSSVSDTTPEEDVARCLMMLSRGVWARKSVLEHEAGERSIDESDDEDDNNEEDEEHEEDGGGEINLRGGNKSKAKYQCGTCKKVFRSYQALGGHRASHKKIRCTSSSSVVAEAHRDTRQVENQNPGIADMGGEDRRAHECRVCFRVFGSGQALGGHKRSHLSGSATATTTTSIISFTTRKANSTKFADNLIDLNLPAPIEDDDMSQIELSAVSDAEFVDPIK
ncbi:hypothetical protein Syun_012431 [Stephania yunnanensis]|uniref:C2H2-type domain-containing protein n=1 Tax=Stephania yunnanensis TaxID=152371 RepID=A0AAP0JZE5_9MAGN